MNTIIEDLPIEDFTGGIDKNMPGHRLEIQPDLVLSALESWAYDPGTGGNVLTGIEVAFSIGAGDQAHVDNSSLFVLNLPGNSGRENVVGVMRSIATLVGTLGAKPQEVSDFFTEVQARRNSEFAHDLLSREE